MPRKLRVEYEGAIYHLMNRGDRREPIFLDDKDREKFLETLAQVCQHYGEELRESEEQKADRLIAETLQKMKWAAEDLKSRPKGNATKARLAKRLRAETTVTWPWIAGRLGMGHWRTARNAVLSVRTKAKENWNRK